jgi:hypothetical protein
MHELMAVLAVSGVALLALLAISRIGAARWRAETHALVQRMEAEQQTIDASGFSADELAGLPAPVQKYFRTALRPGRTRVTGATIEHAGTFNIGERTDNWKPFVSTQHVVTNRPGFVWDEWKAGISP